MVVSSAITIATHSSSRLYHTPLFFPHSYTFIIKALSYTSFLPSQLHIHHQGSIIHLFSSPTATHSSSRLYHTPLFFPHSYTFITNALSYTSFLPPQLHIHHQGSIIHLFSSPTATHSSSRLYHTPLFFPHSYTFIIKALSCTSFLPPQLHIHHQGYIIHLFSSPIATHSSPMLYHTPLFFLHSYTFIIKALSYTSFLPPQLHIHHQGSIIHLFSSPTATHSSSRLYHTPLFFPHSYTFIIKALSCTSFLPPQLHIHHQCSIIHLFSSSTATHSSSRLYHTPLFFPHSYTFIIKALSYTSFLPPQLHIHHQGSIIHLFSSFTATHSSSGLYHTPLFFPHSYTFIIKALSYTSFLPPQLHIHHQGSIIHLFSSLTATHSSSRLYHTPLFFPHSYTFIIKALSYTSFLPP